MAYQPNAPAQYHMSPPATSSIFFSSKPHSQLAKDDPAPAQRAAGSVI